MSYFSHFPARYYKVGNDYVLVPSIQRRVLLSDVTKNAVSAFGEYTIQDGMTPRIIADKLYDDANLEWIVYMVNDIVDFYSEWPMTITELTSYCVRVYGTSVNDTHHYEDGEGNIVGEQHPSYDRIPVSNYEHEHRENDKKRKIKILLPKYVDKLIAEFEEKINE